MLYFFMVAHNHASSCILNPVEGSLEVYENMVEVLLVLEMFLTKDSSAEDLLCGACVTDEADCLVVLTLLQVAFLGKCDD